MHQNQKEFAKLYSDKLERNNLAPAIKMANTMKIDQAQTAIDIGCGSGEFSLWCLKSLPNLKTLYSTDISEDMIALAKEKANAQLPPNIKTNHVLEVADAMDLKCVKDGEVDVAIINLVLHHVADSSKGLQEIGRVLKKGGYVGIGELIKKGEPDSVFGILKNVMHEIGLGDKFKGPHHHHHKEGDDSKKETHNFHVHHDLNEENMAKMLEENGFEMEYCWEDRIVPPILTEEDFVEGILYGHLSKKMLEELNEDDRKLVDEKAKEKFRQFKKEHKPLSMYYLAVIARKK